MTSQQLLILLRREISDSMFENFWDKKRSLLIALELIEEFKKQIQNETINDFLNIYKTMVPDHNARAITADRLSREYENPKNTLVK